MSPRWVNTTVFLSTSKLATNEDPERLGRTHHRKVRGPVVPGTEGFEPRNAETEAEVRGWSLHEHRNSAHTVVGCAIRTDGERDQVAR